MTGMAENTANPAGEKILSLPYIKTPEPLSLKEKAAIMRSVSVMHLLDIEGDSTRAKAKKIAGGTTSQDLKSGNDLSYEQQEAIGLISFWEGALEAAKKAANTAHILAMRDMLTRESYEDVDELKKCRELMRKIDDRTV